MSDKARYGISMAIGLASGAVYLSAVWTLGLSGEAFAPLVGFVVTFCVSMAALNTPDS